MKSLPAGGCENPSSTSGAEDQQIKIDGGLFDYLLSSSAAAKDERIHAYIRTLLLFGEIEKAKEVANTCTQKQRSSSARNAITVGVLAAIGGVTASLTLGPVGFVIGSKLATFVPFAAYQTGAFIGASSAIAGGVAGGDTAKKAAQRLFENVNQSGNAINGDEIKCIYTHDDFRQDEDFILRLAESRKLGDFETIEATISCYLNYLMKSRPSHPIFRQFQPSDPYLTIVALSREVKQNYWDPASRLLNQNQQDVKQKKTICISADICFRVCEILIMNDEGICKAMVAKIYKFKKQQSQSIRDICEALRSRNEPEWLLDVAGNEQSRLLFTKASNQLVSMKRINSAHLKLELLEDALQILCSALKESRSFTKRIIGADEIFPAAIHLCATVASKLDLPVQLEYISILIQVPGDIFPSFRLNGRYEYAIMTFRAALHALETMGTNAMAQT